MQVLPAAHPSVLQDVLPGEVRFRDHPLPSSLAFPQGFPPTCRTGFRLRRCTCLPAAALLRATHTGQRLVGYPFSPCLPAAPLPSLSRHAAPHRLIRRRSPACLPGLAHAQTLLLPAAPLPSPAPSTQVIIYTCVGLGCFLFIVGYPTLWRIFVTFPISCFMFIGRWAPTASCSPTHTEHKQALCWFWYAGGSVPAPARCPCPCLCFCPPRGVAAAILYRLRTSRT